MTLSPPRIPSSVALGAAALLGTACLLGTSLPDAALAALPAMNETVMVSVAGSTPPLEGDASSSNSAVSADGRFVAFVSFAKNLTTIDPRATSQVYKRDMLTGVTTLVSLGVAGTAAGNKQSSDPSISADGRFVAFVSAASDLTLPLEAGNTSKQIYVRDTLLNTTRKLSVTPGVFAGGDEESGDPTISADGTLVAFQSGADDLVAGITPTEVQVYVARNAVDPMVRLVSARNGTAAGLADAGSTQPSISGDGSTVVFASTAGNLTTTPSGGVAQVYVRDIARNLTQLISYDRTDHSIAGNGVSGDPTVSADGSRIAYESTSRNLVSAIVNFKKQIFLFDRLSTENQLVSFSVPNLVGTTGQVKEASITADGSQVAFTSTPGFLTTTPDNGFEQVYLRDMSTSTTRMVSLGAGGSSGGGSEDSLSPALAPDGEYIGFTSFSTGLSPTPATVGRPQIYLRSLGAAAPTPTPTPTAEPTTTPTSTTGPGTPPATGSGTGTGSAGGGQGVAGGGGGSERLASTGMSQAPIIVAGVSAAVLALVGGSILFGARTARRRKIASENAAGRSDSAGRIE